MKNKGIFEWIHILLFLILISIPSVGMLYYKTDMSAEKRTAAAFPQLKKEGKINTKFFDELDLYYKDHFAYRQEMITLDEILSTKLFETSQNKDVIYGTEGWLFYGETMDEYMRRNVLSDRQIHNAARSLKLMQDYAKSYDANFIVAIAPIKAELYGRYMPGNYLKPDGENNFIKLKKAMDKEGVNYVDLHDAFAKDKRIMYHKHDTHWNNEGAAFAQKLIQKELNNEYTDYDTIKKSIKKDFKGDLMKMLYPKGSELDYNVYYDKEFEFKYADGFKNTEDFKISAMNGSKDKSLVMYRDSYGNSLVPFMAEEYGNSFFTKIVPFNLEEIKEHKATDVVMEITQRHISYFTKYLPVMEAEFKTINSLDEKEMNVKVNCKFDNITGKYVIYGSLDKKYWDEDSNVFVRVKDSKYVTDYEAYPVGYNDVNSEDEYAFSMYVGKDEIVPGESEIEVISDKDNKYTSSGVVLKVE